MLETLGSFVVSFLVSFLRGWLSDIRAASAQKEAGAAEAQVKGQQQEEASLKEAGNAIDAARANHRTDATDNAFKHTEFRD